MIVGQMDTNASRSLRNTLVIKILRLKMLNKLEIEKKTCLKLIKDHDGAMTIINQILSRREARPLTRFSFIVDFAPAGFGAHNAAWGSHHFASWGFDEGLR